MYLDFSFLITSFVMLFVILDPIGYGPIFMSLTKGLDRAARAKIAGRAVLTAGFVLFAFALLGEIILNFFGITLPSFKIAGGLLLFITALDMVFEFSKRPSGSDQDDIASQDPSIFPLAIPLLAGPGAITTVMLIANTHGGWIGIFEVSLVASAVLVIIYLVCRLANVLERALGPMVTDIVKRVFGLLLAALSVQFVLDGILSFLAAAQ